MNAKQVLCLAFQLGFAMDENLAAFLKVLDPVDNSTGGGTAAAVAGAMAAALVGMVARLSMGREEMAEKPFYEQIAAEAEDLSKELFRGGWEDSEAFKAVMTSFKMPKETDEQRARRREAIDAAMVKAALIPLANAERCQTVLDLKKKLAGLFSPNAASDLTCAEHLANAGLLGCLANVQINLPSTKDKTQADEIAERAKGLGRWVEGQNQDRLRHVNQ